MKKINVLHYFHVAPFTAGGVETHIANLAKMLKSKVKSSVLSDMDYSAKERKIEALDVYRVGPEINTTQRLRKGLNVLLHEREREKSRLNFMQSFDYDILHMHGPITFSNLSLNGFWFWWAYNWQAWTKTDKPIVFTFHGLPEAVYQVKSNNPILKWLSYIWKWIEKRNIHDAKRVICVDQYEIDLLKKYKIPELEKVEYIPNAVDRKVFKPIKRSIAVKKINSKLGLDLKERDKIISFIGRLSKEKGIDYLYKIAKLRGEFKLLIVGDGPFRKHIEKIKDTRFIMTGAVPNSFMPYVMNASDYVLNLSLHPGSTFVTIESIACGTPVIMKEVYNRYPLINGRTGYTFRNNKGFRQTMEQIISESKSDFDNNDFNSVIKDFDLKITANRIYNVYKSVLGRH